MTDHRDTDRRNGDRVLAEQVAELIIRMDDYGKARTAVGGDEGILKRMVEHDELVKDVPIIRAQVGEIIDVLDGPEQKQLDGSTYRENGMRDQMDSLFYDSQNGGIKTRVSMWTALAVALIGAGGAILGALIVAASVT